MCFLIERCGTFIPSRTVSSNAWTSKKAKRARPELHLRHFPSTSMRRGHLPLLPHREGPVLTGVPPLRLAGMWLVTRSRLVFTNATARTGFRLSPTCSPIRYGLAFRRGTSLSRFRMIKDVIANIWRRRADSQLAISPFHGSHRFERSSNPCTRNCENYLDNGP